MATPFEQDIAAIRQVLHLAESARGAPAQLMQHRPLVDAIKRALALLQRPHPHDEPLRFAVLALLTACRPGESGTWYVHDAAMHRFAMDQLARLYGPIE